MKRVVVHSAGGYDRLTIASEPDPVPGPGEVAIDVEAIGVNFADCVVRMGLYPSAKEYVGWPITPGFEVAGRVGATGAGVTDLDVGTRVIGLVRFGAYATRVVAPRNQVFEAPDAMTDEQAAAFSVVPLTAYYTLCELCRLRPNMRLLVHSAAGGVGGALLQIGKVHACDVTGVVGANAKVETAKRLGADHVIDKSREALWKRASEISPGGFHVILDANGVETLRQSYRHLAPTGRLVIYGFSTMLRRGGTGRPPWLKLAKDFVLTPWFSPMDMTNDNKSVMAFNLSYLFDENELLREAMDALFGWAAAGKLVPPPITEYALDRVADAHRALESGATVGKIVLRP